MRRPTAETAEYEAQFREARAEVYREQEETRRRWLADQAAQVAEARSSAEAGVARAKVELASEAAGARQNLLETSGALADQIATAVLARRPLMRRLVPLFLLACTVCFAQEKGGESGDALGMWRWVNFAILAAGIGYLLAKNLPTFFSSRTSAIQKEIAEAQRLKQESEQRSAAILRRVSSLSADIEAFRVQSRAGNGARGSSASARKPPRTSASSTIRPRWRLNRPAKPPAASCALMPRTWLWIWPRNASARVWMRAPKRAW